MGELAVSSFCIVGMIWVRLSKDHLDLDRVGRAKLTLELKINMV